MAGKFFYEMSFTDTVQTNIMSMHDKSQDAYNNVYFPSEIFKGFAARKIKFITAAVKKGSKTNIVVISHINLLLVGWLIKKISPKTTICLFAHGIEIWGDAGWLKKKMIKSCDIFICVSNFTKSIVQKKHAVHSSKCFVVNNCIDPFLPLPRSLKKDTVLMQKYGYTSGHFILFTLSRLSSKDRYKGYDKVMEALALLKEKYTHIRYIIGGGYDDAEKEFVDSEIVRLKLQKIVTIAGYLPEEDLASYFAMADVYVMPSKKEGFGIVFNEAMYYGLPVIAGNADGSVDALKNGELGLLVDPEDVDKIKEAIEKIIKDTAAYTPNKKLLMDNFSYEKYKLKLQQLLKKE